MKLFKQRPSLFVYGFLGLITFSCLLYRHCLVKPSSLNPLALPTGVSEKLINVQGELISKLFPGPPEYSSINDGDREDYCWILKLDEPSFLKAISTPVAEPANTLDNIKKRNHPDEIMLVLEENMENFCQQYQNREVLSEGYLFHAHTAHHYTPLLMHVKGLKIKAASTTSP